MIILYVLLNEGTLNSYIFVALVNIYFFCWLCIINVLCWNYFNCREATITREDLERCKRNKLYSAMSMLMQNSCFRLLIMLFSLMPLKCMNWSKISQSPCLSVSFNNMQYPWEKTTSFNSILLFYSIADIRQEHK